MVGGRTWIETYAWQEQKYFDPVMRSGVIVRKYNQISGPIGQNL